MDILVDESGHHHIIELSPDLAISPPEGDIVVEKFLDFLFPDSRAAKKVTGENMSIQYDTENVIVSPHAIFETSAKP